jgi:hypothetical protein
MRRGRLSTVRPFAGDTACRVWQDFVMRGFWGTLVVVALLVTACTSSHAPRAGSSSGAVASGGESTASTGSTPGPSPSTSGASPTAAIAPSASPSSSRTGPLTTGPNMQPGEKPPQLSSYSHGHDAAGALGFATYFVKALDWGYATNDPYLIQQISSSKCSACVRFTDALQSLDPTGRELHGSRITIISAGIATGRFTVMSDYVVKLVLKDQAAILSSKTAAPSTVAPASPNYTSLIFISWTSSGWTVVEDGAP